MSQSIVKERRVSGHPIFGENKSVKAQSTRRMPVPANPIWLSNTHKEWEKYLQAGHCFKFRTRDYIPQFQQGEQGIYYLKYGRARVLSADPQHKGTPLYYFGAGTLLYEFSAAKEQYPCQVYAVTPVEAYFYPLSIVMSEHFAQSHPQLLLSIINGQSKKNSYYLRRLSAIIEGKAFANVCRLFFDLSRSCDNASDLSLGITQEELASLLCVRRCWLGKILRRLKDENVIGRCTKSRLVISDMDKLASYAFAQ